MTAKLEHTPGPWVADQDLIRDGSDNLVAKVSSSFGLKEAAPANARLIAAAPEMLELLHDIRDHVIDLDGRPGRLSRQIDDLLNKIRGSNPDGRSTDLNSCPVTTTTP